MSPSRPVMRYHGGKWRLAPWVISHFSPHEVYVEPFCGAASVLVRKPRARVEIINDLDDEICNVFRVLRDPGTALELERAVRLTPFSRAEFLSSYYSDAGMPADPVERARLTLVRCGMGFGSSGLRAAKTGFRAKGYVRRTGPAFDWMRYPDQIGAFCDRLMGVIVENVPAIELVTRYDSPETLFYVDPPYTITSRTSLGKSGRQKAQYAFEMSDDDHRSLAVCLRELRGKVVLSGYRSALYDQDLFRGWLSVEKEVFSIGGKRRVEVLWLNTAAAHCFYQEGCAPGVEERMVR